MLSRARRPSPEAYLAIGTRPGQRTDARASEGMESFVLWSRSLAVGASAFLIFGSCRESSSLRLSKASSFIEGSIRILLRCLPCAWSKK
jgi:hypothetical protein